MLQSGKNFHRGNGFVREGFNGLPRLPARTIVQLPSVLRTRSLRHQMTPDGSPQAERATNPVRPREQSADGEVLPLGSGWGSGRGDVVEEPAVLIVVDDQHRLWADLW